MAPQGIFTRIPSDMRKFGPQLSLDLRIQRSRPTEPPQRLQRDGKLAPGKDDAVALLHGKNLHRVPPETAGNALRGRLVAGVVRMQVHHEQAAGDEGTETVVVEDLRGQLRRQA